MRTVRRRFRNNDASASATTVFAVSCTIEHGDHLVCLAGELDIASRDRAYEACVAGGSATVVVDLSELSFLDCAGYGRLVAACNTLQDRGGSLRLQGAVGQPAHLLALVETHQAQS